MSPRVEYIIKHVAAYADGGETRLMPLAERLGAVQERIRGALDAAGRSQDAVQLIAVSKRQPIAAIREAHAAGCRDFGENYAQELIDKAEQLSDLDAIRWHHIGGLQRNKVKLVLPKVTLLHGVDSPRLLETIEGRAKQLGVQAAVLIQVNLGAEATKSGCRPSDLAAILEAAAQCVHVDVRGLMAIPPRDAAAASHFEQLCSLRDVHGGVSRLPELSMGMSQDFERAIEHGATMVRVGSAIFGPRV
jgi:pyridoxal phosphate enzyme (YggS family)